MAQILIRNMDDGVVARLKEKAAARKTSLEQFLREVLEGEARSDRAHQLSKLRELREGAGVFDFDFTAAIRDDRDSR